MGVLLNGAWQVSVHESRSGEFIRDEAVIRNRVTADGSSGTLVDNAIGAAVP